MNTLLVIAYYPILGLPLIIWSSLLTLLLFAFTAAIPLLHLNRVLRLSIKWHMTIAIIALILGLIHAIVGILITLS